MSDNTKKVQCIHCFHFFSKDSNSTLKNHIPHPHCEALKRAAEPGQLSMSRDGSIFVYNPDVLYEQFASLVIQRGLLFNHFEDEQTTRVFQKYFQPKYNHENETMFLVLSHMAMDILSVQATSVAFESAFSTSERVLSIQRTRLTPASLEMYFEEEILDTKVQTNKVIPLSDEEIALDAASSEGSSDYIGVMDIVFLVMSLDMLSYQMYSYCRTRINTLYIVSLLIGYLIQKI
nr:zinc finger BED domain-containing protein RICESLEEPER 2-like [Tanacetum cinerariifolium]